MNNDTPSYIAKIIDTNAKLTNELIAAQKEINEKTQTTIAAYEKCFLKCSDNEKLRNIISKKDQEISELQRQIQANKDDAVCEDLIRFEWLVNIFFSRFLSKYIE